MSTKTVSTTIKALVESNFLNKINSGAYRVNLMYSSRVAKIIVLMFSYSTEMKKTINNTSHCVSLRRWQPKS